MYSVENQNLWEAYQSIYEPQELTEEVEIAAHYFYEMGLNEEGVQILIEELGVKEFTDFVYDIVESYYLNEGEHYQGVLFTKPKNKSQQVRGFGDSRKKPGTGTGAFEKVTHTPTSGSKSSEAPHRTSDGQQEIDFSGSSRPRSTGRKHRRHGRVRSGARSTSNRSAAVNVAQKTQPKSPQSSQSAQNNPPKRGGNATANAIARVILSGIERHNKANKKLAPVVKGLGQTFEILKKGIGTAAKAAVSEDLEAWVNELINEGYDLSEYTWDDMAEIYMEEVEQLDEASPHISRSIDLFDTILEYLVAEGYADTNEAALAIMANMSEEWRLEILDEAAKDQSDKQIERGIKTTYKAGNVLDNRHQGRSPGLNRLSRGEREKKIERMRERLKARRDDLFGERRNRENAAREEMKKKYGL